MRRKIWILIICVAIVLAMEYSLSAYTTRVITGYAERVQGIEQYIVDGDWRTASDSLAAIRQDWEKTRAMLEIWISHDEAEQAAEDMRSLTIYLSVESSEDSLEAIEALRGGLEHIYHKYKLSAANLL